MIKIKRRKLIEQSADITPLIDVVFILLIFFMLTTVTVPLGMSVDLPEANSTAPQTDTELILSITKDEQIYYNQQLVTIEQLKERLAKEEEKRVVVVQGDKHIAYGLFVKVMDAIREHGNHKIVLAAEQE